MKLLSSIVLLGTLLLFFFSPVHAQCLDNEAEVIVEILPDNFPEEISWSLSYQGGATIASGAEMGSTHCVEANTCINFTINDAAGDGICCGFGEGEYSIFYDGSLTANGGQYASSESVIFGCPIGQSCDSATEISEGEYEAPVPDTWYTFVPNTSGQYRISTCEPANSCLTRLYVYDYCLGLEWTEGNEATIYYSDDFCATGGEVNAIFEAGNTYFIRIGDIDTDCAEQSIQWGLSFLGSISGCTDPNACNFNPLATINDQTSCIYPGDPECDSEGPDLIVLEDVLVSSIYLDYLFNNDGCLIEENCMNGYGEREIVRFTTHIENIGNEDYTIGSPPSDGQTSDQFVYDPCHGHWHYKGYAEYSLYDFEGNEIPIGFKNGFCVMDLSCSYGGGTPKFGCNYMGISAKCGDIYSSGLSCQWIDITDLEIGKYTLAVKVNWDQAPDVLGKYETDYTNNWAQACIEIVRPNGQTQVSIYDGCEPHVDCVGQLYGSTDIDCEGVCGGVTLRGDLNSDTSIDSADTYAYMDIILNESAEVSNCNDLNSDEQITITDAVLAHGCYLQANDLFSEEWAVIQDLCKFPNDIFNPNQTVQFEIINGIGGADILIHAPQTYLRAFQFEVSGFDIIDVEFLTENNVNGQFEYTENMLTWMSYEDAALPKNNPSYPNENYYHRIRIEFNIWEQVDVFCIEKVWAVVNDRYEEVAHELIDYDGDDLDPGCAQLFLVDIENIEQSISNVQLIPNPNSGNVTLFFENQNNSIHQLDIKDVTGKEVLNIENIHDDYIGISTGNWPTGVYIYTLSNKNGSYTNKMLVQ